MVNGFAMTFAPRCNVKCDVDIVPELVQLCCNYLFRTLCMEEWVRSEGQSQSHHGNNITSTGVGLTTSSAKMEKKKKLGTVVNVYRKA